MEELLATGKLKVVFATDTLALEINVPARSTVIGKLTKWDGQTRRVLTSGEYRQLMAGRDEEGWTRSATLSCSTRPGWVWTAHWRSPRGTSFHWRALSAPATARCSTCGTDQERRSASQSYRRKLRQFQHGGRSAR